MERRAKRESLKKLRQGQREACEALVCRHYRSIYNFLLYLAADTGLAEELTQETFASAWADLGGYRGRASLGTWLRRIAYRKFVDSRRGLKRDAALLAKLTEGRQNERQTSDPLSRVAADEHSRLLYEAILALGSSERAVIVLHYIQGLSFRQMAKVLAEPVGTVKWRTSRALRKLKAYLTGRV
ncbi:MAG: RNA polymerase sigma factor [Planctomycetota bacterium]